MSNVQGTKDTVNGSHDTIHIFKNYFATVFSVFGFQFSVSPKISCIQMDPNGMFGSLERKESRGEESSGEESRGEPFPSTLFGCFLN